MTKVTEREEQDLAKRIDQWALEHEEELIRDLMRVVDCESVSKPGEGGYAMGIGCKNCADLMLALGRKYGFETENDDYYCVSVLYPGETKKELGILGHMDVVPAGNDWHYEPYHSVYKDGFVIGRGSSDNKGPTMMSLYVLRCMKELSLNPRHTIRLIAGFNEESGMRDVEHYLQGHCPPEYTLICDGGWAMCIGEKGILTADLVLDIPDGNLKDICGGVASNSVPDTAQARLKVVPAKALVRLKEDHADVEIEDADGEVVIRTRGKAAHAFVPHEGENAIYKLLRFLCEYGLVTGNAAMRIKALRECFSDDYGTGLCIDKEDDISGKTTCIGGMIRMENGKIYQNINVRFAIKQDSEQLLENLKERCRKLGIQIENLSYSKPRYTSPELSTTKLLMDTCHEFLERKYEPYVMGGGTHARKFPNALPYGPGIMDYKNPFGSPHGVDEAICIEHLTQAMKVYIIALLRLDEHFNL